MLRACGHIFSEKSRQAVNGTQCLVCNASFKESDAVPLCGSEAAVEALLSAAKATKKRKRQEPAEAAGGVAAPPEGGDDVAAEAVSLPPVSDCPAQG